MSVKKTYIDRLLAEPNFRAGDPALNKKNKIYRWTRAAANTRAEKGEYASVGNFRHVLNEKTNKYEQSDKPSKQKRTLNNATAKVWFPETKTDKQIADAKYLNLGRDVRFLGSIPIGDFLTDFKGSYREAKDETVDPAEPLNIFLSGKPKQLLTALRLQGVFPPSVTDQKALEFIDRYSFYPDVLEAKTEAGDVNPDYDPKRY
jgi:hypothetical protein